MIKSKNGFTAQLNTTMHIIFFFKLIYYTLFKTYLLKNFTRESKITWMRIWIFQKLINQFFYDFWYQNIFTWLYQFSLFLHVIVFYILFWKRLILILPKNWQVWHIVYFNSTDLYFTTSVREHFEMRLKAEAG